MKKYSCLLLMLFYIPVISYGASTFYKLKNSSESKIYYNAFIADYTGSYAYSFACYVAYIVTNTCRKITTQTNVVHRSVPLVGMSSGTLSPNATTFGNFFHYDDSKPFLLDIISSNGTSFYQGYITCLTSDIKKCSVNTITSSKDAKISFKKDKQDDIVIDVSSVS